MSDYSERLTVPLRWWVQGIMLVATLWLAVAVATPDWAWVALTTALAAGGLLVAGLLNYGQAEVRVTDTDFTAGRATIPLRFIGKVEALDAEATRRVAGVDADARAFLVLRPYLHRSVRVELTDPADPTPYWLISTRRPSQLAEALTAARSTLPD